MSPSTDQSVVKGLRVWYAAYLQIGGHSTPTTVARKSCKLSLKYDIIEKLDDMTIGFLVN